MSTAGPPDPTLNAPLAAFAGAPPPAPAWFREVLAAAPEAGSLTVAGARIETLSWGERGRPGLLLLHGSGAHAGWWRFIAPFLADGHRVAALSWSGMGGSDWREAYGLDLFADEAERAAEAAGLFAAGPPLMVGHSFGSLPMLALAGRSGPRWRGAVLVDPPIFSPERRHRPARGDGAARTHRVYPTLAEALARFRFAPVQPCDTPYIADLIARESLKPVAGGFTWRFDPALWGRLRLPDRAALVGAARCPLALVCGARSDLMRPADAAYVTRLLPAGSPRIDVPEAYHHVMVDQPLAFVAALRALLAAWPGERSRPA
ncbi:alpha/beta fold hydrolase [Methylobacterium crusticola]|uniref:alpha/beta fold hydrolase n=1 Tax=Methylobacterium crusticola TaxID=1697972 RepID=UPI0019399F36|nr:alpha/beta hydrolase [Methylobacterium crusticola]